MPTILTQLTRQSFPRQQFQPATCGAWTVANAAALAHRKKVAHPATPAESHTLLRPWLNFINQQTAAL